MPFFILRLYFHAVTCQPVRPQELDTEGRDESKPFWLRQKTVMVRMRASLQCKYYPVVFFMI